MAMLPDVFIPEETEDASFEIIPACWIEAEIVKSTIETTKDKKGKYISLKYVITEEGKYEGRMIFPNLNIVNASDVAVRIGKSDLKKICAAVGLDPSVELEDTEDLHNIPHMIKLTVKAANSNWPEKNEVKDYKSIAEYDASLSGESE
jgi:hypothetical protein